MNRSLIVDLLQPGALRSHLQPIYRLTGHRVELSGFECLTRGPAGSNLEQPDVLFEYVRRKHEEELIDRFCVSRGLLAARELPATTISVNVHASTLGRDWAFAEFLARASRYSGVPCDRIVVEIVEHSPFWDIDAFKSQLAAIRRLGARIALDDIGLGYSNYRMILQTLPEVFKVDRFLVNGCSEDAHRVAVLSSLIGLARSLGAVVIAEGVETPDDLACLEDLGVREIQGHLFCEARSPGDLNRERGWERPFLRRQTQAVGAAR